jgi:hypothetical protein
MLYNIDEKAADLSACRATCQQLEKQISELEMRLKAQVSFFSKLCFFVINPTGQVGRARKLTGDDLKLLVPSFQL